MSKYRKKGVKRQHTVLEGFLSFLESLSEKGFAKSIIPGRISTKGNKATSGRSIVEYQYETKTGVKLILKKGTSVQEVFVVSDNKEKIKEFFGNEKRIEI